MSWQDDLQPVNENLRLTLDALDGCGAADVTIVPPHQVAEAFRQIFAGNGAGHRFASAAMNIAQRVWPNEGSSTLRCCGPCDRQLAEALFSIVAIQPPDIGEDRGLLFGVCVGCATTKAEAAEVALAAARRTLFPDARLLVVHPRVGHA